ncbi:MAG: hypothetical protein MUC57_11705, partial [Desulfobacterales bacterium]|nr:hypothetical protein [Desulfobacterales bacterium]
MKARDAFANCFFFALAMIFAAGFLPAEEDASGDKKTKTQIEKPLFQERVVVTAKMSPKELKNCSDSLLVLTRPE